MTTVYVYLLSEGTDVWRAVAAERVAADVYRLDPAARVPDGESWQFFPGQTVNVSPQRLSSGDALVAVRLRE